MSALLDLLPRPLDSIRSIKLKLSILLGASGFAGVLVFWWGIGWPAPRTGLTAIAAALVTSQILAHGMTSPLREMTAAARAMARGDYTRRVRATSRDEVGELARAFNQMAADLATADRQRRELIANVSHELRTPISALQGVLENIVDGVAAADPATLRTALAQTERLGRLVAELLDLSRVDAGVVRLDREEVAVGPFLADAVAEASVTAAGAGRSVTFTVDAPPSPLVVSADPGRLHQVFANLLDNAARHSPPDGTVTVSARSTMDEVVFTVTDQGPGIPPSLRDRVFERFTRGSSAPADVHTADDRIRPASSATLTAGPSRFPASPASYPASPASYPASPATYPASPATYPAGSSRFPASSSARPAGSAALPTGPSTHPGGSAALPAGSATYPAGPALPAVPGPRVAADSAALPARSAGHVADPAGLVADPAALMAGSATSPDGGTGLGLAIARWVVDLHGGTIAIADTPVGCQIRLTFPSRSIDQGVPARSAAHLPERSP